MNDVGEKGIDSYRSLLLLDEIGREEPVSQRELSRRAGIALGLVNSYLKNLVAKGYVRIKSFPRNRYGYLLTPPGLAEKSRLAYQHVNYFTNLYRQARRDHAALFARLAAQGVRRVVFCGCDEMAEIAYLSLGEAGIDLYRIVDMEPREDFFGRAVLPISEAPPGETVVVTSSKKGKELRTELLRLGFPGGAIYSATDAVQEEQ
jgi:DNA-binding MarR family transcriptional regulator